MTQESLYQQVDMRSGRRRLLPSIGLFVATSNLQDYHQRSVVVVIVDDPAGSNPNAPGPLLSPKLAYSHRPGMIRQGLNGRRQPDLDFPWQLPQVSLGPTGRPQPGKACPEPAEGASLPF